MSYKRVITQKKRSFWDRLFFQWSRKYDEKIDYIWVQEEVFKPKKPKLYGTTSLGGYKPAHKLKTVSYSPPPAPVPVKDNTTDVLLGAVVGYAIGRMLDDDKPSYSCPAPSPTPFESGGGGDFGGAGASDSWSSDDSSSSSSDSSSSSGSD